MTPEERSRFVRVFNDFADRGADVTDHADFLRNYMSRDRARGREWKSYMDMLAAMDFARKSDWPSWLALTKAASPSSNETLDPLGETSLRKVAQVLDVSSSAS